MRGRKPFPRPEASSSGAGSPLGALPRCPDHLLPAARKEWRRLAKPLHDAGILAVVDRAVLGAFCQAYARWVEAEKKLKETPPLLKTPSGYVQQSPWLAVANKQMELMGRFMAELGLTPSARARISLPVVVGYSGATVVREIVLRGPNEDDVPKRMVIDLDCKPEPERKLIENKAL